MRLVKQAAKTTLIVGILTLGAVLSVGAQKNGGSRPAPTLQSADVLTGTYRWNPSMSENVADVLRTAGNLSDRQVKELSALLKEDESISLEVKGSFVTLASGGGVNTWNADGQTRSDTRAGVGATVRVTVRGTELTVTKIKGATELTTVYSVADDRDVLKVTKRITASYLTDPISSDTFYTRTGDTASGASQDDPSTYSSNDPTDKPATRSTGSTKGSPGRRLPTNRPGDFIVPSGTIITGTLENDIITGVTQDNDRFRLVVIAPSEFKGALITGYVSGVSRSGKVSGRAEVTFNFETIRLTNGRTYDFGGYISSITDPSGKTVAVDTEGTARGDSQTKETAKRGGIGAGIGAVLGGILGGGQGAVIGAVIGGGAGAGSVIAQGKDDLKLIKGTVVNVQASAPR